MGYILGMKRIFDITSKLLTQFTSKNKCIIYGRPQTNERNGKKNLFMAFFPIFFLVDRTLSP